VRVHRHQPQTRALRRAGRGLIIQRAPIGGGDIICGGRHGKFPLGPGMWA